MSRRKNGTNRVALAIGINPYGWGSSKRHHKLDLEKIPARRYAEEFDSGKRGPVVIANGCITLE